VWAIGPPQKLPRSIFFREKKTSGIEISSLRQGFESSVKEIVPRKLLGIASAPLGYAGTLFGYAGAYFSVVWLFWRFILVAQTTIQRDSHFLRASFFLLDSMPPCAQVFFRARTGLQAIFFWPIAHSLKELHGSNYLQLTQKDEKMCPHFS
jgi:hypothetical protein